jgi:hypothetical protein
MRWCAAGFVKRMQLGCSQGTGREVAVQQPVAADGSQRGALPDRSVIDLCAVERVHAGGPIRGA